MTRPKRDKTSVASPVSPTLEFTAESLHNFMKEKFNELEEKVATKACIKNLLHRSNEQKQTINEMNEKIAILESEITHSKSQTMMPNNTIVDCAFELTELNCHQMARWKQGKIAWKKVQEVFSELNAEIPENVIDRAHRIGKVVKINGNNVWQMIVRMTTWRHRTMVYEARKNCGKYKVKLDLTKHRINLLKKANEQFKSDKHSFAFCNINCQPYWFNNGKYHYFNDLEELQNLQSHK